MQHRSTVVKILALWSFLSVVIPITAFAGSDLTLPRYASLRADTVHLRTGPGKRYPVDWIFISRNMPVEITAEFENWRKVRDWQGTEGWVHRALLSKKRTAVVIAGIQPLRRNPDPSSALTARVMEKVVGRLLRCAGKWCRLEIGKHRGWMRRSHIWGVYTDEKLD